MKLFNDKNLIQYFDW